MSATLHAMKRWLAGEHVGAPECPLFVRWTLLAPTRPGRPAPLKLLVHHFLPERHDSVPHDHPRSFLTLVLRGQYADVVPCPVCCGTEAAMRECLACGQSGRVVAEILSAPALRYRPAEHVHLTVAGPRGAWTIVLMGPVRRQWGFWRLGTFFSSEQYVRRFGRVSACD